MSELRACQIQMIGTVQGIGLRPAFARLAEFYQLRGWVANEMGGVRAVIEGPSQPIAEFLDRLRDQLPQEARQCKLVVSETVASHAPRFEIRSSTMSENSPGTSIPRDVVVCGECLKEVQSAENRRSRYPFTSCASCGPRLTIVTAMPFERQNTEMASFRLCAHCRDEYRNPSDRRFHAQTIACPDCGPQVWATDRTGAVLARNDAAVSLVVRTLLKGQIVAVRGVGGYQLVCDATNERAIVELRTRKRRPSKPLAVMVETVRDAERLAAVDNAGRQALLDSANPIVLLPARSGGGLPGSIHPGLADIGLFLPTSPLHWLLVHDCGCPLVVTSGNVEGNPLETDPEAAQQGLANIADIWLHHDRSVRHSLDDSVVRIIAGRAVTLRLGRGLAPLPLDISNSSQAHVLAAGGHQKGAMAWVNGEQAVLGPHIGDLDHLETRHRYERQAEQFESLYRVRPELWVHDLHPDYFSTRWCRSQSVRHLAVQHHHAHIVAGMLEQGWIEREVLGVACDGTGYGPDGTIWGGEFLRATVQGFERVAHIRQFPLIGGELAIREPLRVAAALLQQTISRGQSDRRIHPEEQLARERFQAVLENPRLSLRTSSAGRLFDGVAALILGVTRADFEGQPAQLLEAVSDRSELQRYQFSLEAGQVKVIDWRPVVQQILDDRCEGVTPAAMAMRFHRGLAQIIATVGRDYRQLPIVLGGGVFQNRLLVELLVENLSQHPQPIGLPGIIPPNDGGLAAGQLAIGIWKIHPQR